MCSKLLLIVVLYIVAVAVSGQLYGRQRIINRRQNVHTQPTQTTCTYGSLGPCLGPREYCRPGSTCRGRLGDRQCCVNSQPAQCPYTSQSGCGYQSYDPYACTSDYDCPQGAKCCPSGCTSRCTYVTQHAGGY